MSGPVELRPGVMPLADWRAIYRGASVALDPVARPDVEAGRTALTAIVTRNGNIPPELAGGSATVAELVEGRGEPLPRGLVRLFVALKLGSLGQGMSGIRWSVLKSITAFLTHDLLPVISAEEASDRIAQLRLFAALTGTGEVLREGRVRPAQSALKEAALKPLTLNPRERRALLSGTQLSIASALAGLFEAERVFQSALVTAALTASTQAERPFLQPLVHRLYRQRGQVDVAEAFRKLLGAGGAKAAAASADAPTSDISRESHRMGACLDLLRQAGATLEHAANAVTEDQLVVWQSEEIVRGVEDVSSLAASADLIALTLATVGELCERRMTVALAALKAPSPTAAADLRSLTAKAASFVAENRARAASSGLDGVGLKRLLPIAGTTALVVAIEALEAIGMSKKGSSKGPARLSEVRKLVRDSAPPTRENAAAAAGNLASVAVLVGSGAIASAAGIELPTAAPLRQEQPGFRLGGRRKRT